jgi:hypothetical protein
LTTSKKANMVAALQADWVALPTLMQETGWKAHTARAAISVEAKKLGLVIERRRAEGVTSYRVRP